MKIKIIFKAELTEDEMQELTTNPESQEEIITNNAEVSIFEEKEDGEFKHVYTHKC